MYKSRISLWELDKNNRERDMMVILRKKLQRNLQNKESSFRIRDKPVDLEDVIRYFRRKGMAENPQVAAQGVATPTYISCWTPLPTTPAPPASAKEGPLASEPDANTDESRPSSPFVIVRKDCHDVEVSENARPDQDSSESYTALSWDAQSLLQWVLVDPEVPTTITPPKSFLIPEQLLTTITSYFAGAFETRTWIVNDQDICVSAVGKPSSIHCLDLFQDYCHTGLRLIDRKSYVEGRQLLSSAFNLVQDILKAQDPRTLQSFLSLLLYLKRTSQIELAHMLQRYICAMAATILPYDCPWYRVCRWARPNARKA